MGKEIKRQRLLWSGKCHALSWEMKGGGVYVRDYSRCLHFYRRHSELQFLISLLKEKAKTRGGKKAKAYTRTITTPT